MKTSKIYIWGFHLLLAVTPFFPLVYGVPVRVPYWFIGVNIAVQIFCATAATWSANMRYSLSKEFFKLDGKVELLQEQIQENIKRIKENVENTKTSPIVPSRNPSKPSRAKLKYKHTSKYYKNHPKIVKIPSKYSLLSPEEKKKQIARVMKHYVYKTRTPKKGFVANHEHKSALEAPWTKEGTEFNNLDSK